MIGASFLVPGDLGTPTGGYAYARALFARLSGHGVALALVTLPRAFPHPDAADLAVTAEAIAGTAPDSVLLVDGLAYGAWPPDLIARAAPRRIVALVHHPLGFEAGLEPDTAARLVAGERAALAMADRVVVTSRFTRALLVGEFGVAPERIAVAEPGTEPAARARAGGSGPAALLAVGAVTPRKGYDHLVAALAGLTDLDWTLIIAGACDRAGEHAAALRERITAAGLDARITLAGAVSPERLDALYAAADIVVSPSLFEGFGMALAEAMARGLPIVASSGGAAADTVPDAAGLKVPPGDVPALAAALRRMLEDPERRRAAADASWRAGQGLARWDDTASIVAAALREARS